MGREALAGAAAVFVGSEHIRAVLEEVVGHVERVHEVPPGVDVEEFRPRPRDEALAGAPRGGRAATRRTRATPTSESRTRATPSGSPRSSPASEPTVVYFGKLLYNKGVHLLLEALRGLDARAVIVGFGDYREELEGAAPGRTRCSPGRSSTGTSSTCYRSRT